MARSPSKMVNQDPSNMFCYFGIIFREVFVYSQTMFVVIYFNQVEFGQPTCNIQYASNREIFVIFHVSGVVKNVISPKLWLWRTVICDSQHLLSFRFEMAQYTQITAKQMQPVLYQTFDIYYTKSIIVKYSFCPTNLRNGIIVFVNKVIIIKTFLIIPRQGGIFQ